MSQLRLTDKELNHYEKILLKEKETALNIIRKLTDNQRLNSKDSSGDLSSYSLHQADQGTDTSSRETQTYLLEEQQKKLKNINSALRRIYDKTYGVCQITGKLISSERLKAVPYAKYSIEAKTIEESKSRR